MELRHLRYFVAVAEERSFVHAARRLRVAQPALSKQIRNLEAELGVTLFQRLPRGVCLTPAGEAFLFQARPTLANAALAISSARQASGPDPLVLRFGQGEEMGVYASVVADILGSFRNTHPEVDIQVGTRDQAEQLAALRERRVDVAVSFLAAWPASEFDAHRMLDCSLTGVLLPASHPLATRPTIRLADLRDLTFLHHSGVHWPETFRIFQAALRDRGLTPAKHRERAMNGPSGSVEIAAGSAWTLANAATAAPLSSSTSSIVYRPFVEPPIPAWLAFIWLPDAPKLIHEVVAVARTLGLELAEDHRTAALERV